MRLIIVSNRLPYKIQKRHEKLTYKQSEGGLATGLISVFKDNTIDNIWVGWPGYHFDSEEEKDKVKKELIKKNLMPVFLSKEEIKNYYQGFSNETLWPTFHYFTQYTRYVQQYWEAYVRVNKKFADILAKTIQPGDVVWIHDYQLLLLPQMIRKLFPEVSIGFFQHIPFPSYEVFRTLPWRKEILKGMIGADLIGFHTYDDVRHFLSSVNRILGINNFNEQLEITGRPVLIDLFPMGIDYDKYSRMAASDEVIAIEKKYRSSFGDKKIILSIDRLDYTKGIAQRLIAFEKFLEKYPEYHEQVSFIQIVVPSRDQVEKYNALHEEINMLVGRINSSYRTINWEPITYFYRSFQLPMLSAFYRIADIALLTPMRDGMNLVSKEFVASKLDQRGVLILSEMAGASKELSDAILINPNDTLQIVEALHKALNLPEEEQVKNMQNMQRIVKKLNVFQWTSLFMDRLEYIKQIQKSLSTKKLDGTTFENIYQQYHTSHNRLIFLDYDGTLVPFSPDPRLARPDDELVDLLKDLSADPRNKVILTSGRNKNTLDQWLGFLPIDMVAEHGVWIKQESIWQTLVELNDLWKTRILFVMENYVVRTPGSFIEEKDFSLVWHYRKVEKGLAEMRAHELSSHLRYLASNFNLQVLEGNKVVEVKSVEIDKGKAALQWLKKYTHDFIIVIGDDWTDEDMYKVMPESAITIKVNSNVSAARYSINSYLEVRKLLADLINPQFSIKSWEDQAFSQF